MDLAEPQKTAPAPPHLSLPWPRQQGGDPHPERLRGVLDLRQNALLAGQQLASTCMFKQLVQEAGCVFSAAFCPPSRLKSLTFSGEKWKTP